MAAPSKNGNEPEPMPVTDRTPLGHVFLTGIVFGLGVLAVGGVVRLATWAMRPDNRALPEGE